MQEEARPPILLLSLSLSPVRVSPSLKHTVLFCSRRFLRLFGWLGFFPSVPPNSLDEPRAREVSPPRKNPRDHENGETDVEML